MARVKARKTKARAAAGGPRLVPAYRAGYSAPVPAAEAHAELEAIRLRNDGVLRPADVVEESRDDDAPLHPCFTWDDWAAAEKCRQDEARRLVRSVVLVRPAEGDRPREVVPQYLHVTAAEGRDAQGYRAVAEVVSDADLAARAVADALAALRGWQKRYGWIAELAGVTAAIDAAALAVPGV